MLVVSKISAALAVMIHLLFGATLVPVAGAVQPAESRPAHHGCTSTNWRHQVTAPESWIIAHEHGEKLLSQVSDRVATTDPNPRSSAFGLGQLLYSTREQYYPRWADLDTTSPCIQLVGMRAYIKDRYGSGWAAYDFWVRHHWY